MAKITHKAQGETTGVYLVYVEVNPDLIDSRRNKMP